MTDKPNVLLILADDVGWFDVSAYNRGVMGGQTPNIDRVAAEGALFTDAYAQASCTAGRAAFITGQIPLHTGLTTVGMPGAKQGLQPEDPTLAELLKPEGYMTAQHGKNHLGDRRATEPADLHLQQRRRGRRALGGLTPAVGGPGRPHRSRGDTGCKRQGAGRGCRSRPIRYGRWRSSRS